MISGLILSKNRASQLRFLLESISINAPNLFNEIRVIYTSTDDDFSKGYDKLKEEQILPNIVWQKEKDFVPDFLNALKSCESEYICGIVDDCVIYKPLPTTGKMIEEMFSDDVFCFSLRLGLNTIVQNYMRMEEQYELEQYQQNPYCIRWEWKNWDSRLNYGYPISLDGHIFRTKELSDLSHKFDFEYLRQWEGVIAGKCREETNRGIMVAYKQSVLFSIPSNCVQDPPLVAGQIYAFSEKELNNKYINNDEVIDFDGMQYAFQNVCWAHNEFPLVFKKIGDRDEP